MNNFKKSTLKTTSSYDNLMWDIWMSMYHLPIVTVADELGIFSHLGKRNLSSQELAKLLNISRRAIEILMEPLIGLRFLTKKKKTYSLTQIACTYLLPDSPFYWGPVLINLRKRDEHRKILEAINNDSNQLSFENKTFTDMWKEGSITEEAARVFTQKMHATIFSPAVNAIKTGLLKPTKNLLDVGGGSGCFSIAYLQAYPDYQSTVFDLPPVCEVAKKYIHEYDLNNKISTHAGNFFIKSNWPHGHDGILMSQIVHDWPIEDCRKIITYAYETLPKNGKIYIHEMLLNDDRSSPLTTACFDLLMFINHKSQQFTKDELFDLLYEAGFKSPKIKKTFGYYSIITAKK